MFADLSFKDVVSWNVLICGYSQNGFVYDAMRTFVDMLREKIRICGKERRFRSVAKREEGECALEREEGELLR